MFAILLLDMGHQLIKAYLAASVFFCVCVSRFWVLFVSALTQFGAIKGNHSYLSFFLIQSRNSVYLSMNNGVTTFFL